MDFKVGQYLEISNEKYKVVGIIKFKNLKDSCFWKEYRLLKESGNEFWLAYDDDYEEYSLSMVMNNASLEKFHLVDNGTAEVVDLWGDVDVEKGDRVNFSEYEDESEENIISIEQWEDMKETSFGYYIDADEVSITSPFSEIEEKNNKNFGKYIGIIGGVIAILGLIFFFVNRDKTPTIKEYLEKNPSLYSYETSITGEKKEKADVYKSIYNVDTTVKNIIYAIEGKVEDIQENKSENGENSVGILTKNEYCFVYEEENGNNIFIQISNRKFAYTSSHTPYRSSYWARSFYRNYYFSRAYADDFTRYKKYGSPYASYKGEYLRTNPNDKYKDFAEDVRYTNSVRQSSSGRRSFSGGGLSSGK